MQKLFSVIGQYPIISFQSEGTIAKCDELYFSPEDLVCRIIKVRSNELFKKITKYVVWDDILEISNGFYVQDQEVLVDPEELVRLKEIIDFGCVIVGMQVETQSGQDLGTVYDFSLEVDTGSIIKIHVISKSLLLTEKKVIARSQIYDVKKNTIIVYDTLVEDEETELALKNVKKLEAEPSVTVKNDYI
jgi:sporulation protein YlmC with PRC-barrel domain